MAEQMVVMMVDRMDAKSAVETVEKKVEWRVGMLAVKMAQMTVAKKVEQWVVV